MRIRTLRISLLLSFAVLSFVSVTSLASPGGGNLPARGPMPSEVSPGNYAWWRLERARRQAAIDQYIASNYQEFLSFKNAPLAIKQDPLNFVGIQMIMFRLFPVIFPDIWGLPADQMATIGFGPDPFQPASVMPLGTGYSLSNSFTIPGTPLKVRVNYATLSCMGCHSGGVTAPGGTLTRLVGAPNPIGSFLGQLIKP